MLSCCGFMSWCGFKIILKTSKQSLALEDTKSTRDLLVLSWWMEFSYTNWFWDLGAELCLKKGVRRRFVCQLKDSCPEAKQHRSLELRAFMWKCENVYLIHTFLFSFFSWLLRVVVCIRYHMLNSRCHPSVLMAKLCSIHAIQLSQGPEPWTPVVQEVIIQVWTSGRTCQGAKAPCQRLRSLIAIDVEGVVWEAISVMIGLIFLHLNHHGHVALACNRLSVLRGFLDHGVERGVRVRVLVTQKGAIMERRG